MPAERDSRWYDVGEPAGSKKAARRTRDEWTAVYLSNPAGGPDVKQMIQRFRVPLGFVIAAAVLYLAQPTTKSIAFGLPVAVIGAAFRFLAAGVIRKDSSLATTGVYAWTRNPLYFGSFMLAAGFAIMSAGWLAAALLVLPSILIYPVVIRREEAHLEKLFPKEFVVYRAGVPCFIPRPKPSKMSFSMRQYMANREYNTLIGFAVVLGLLIVKTRTPLLT